MCFCGWKKNRKEKEGEGDEEGMINGERERKRRFGEWSVATQSNMAKGTIVCEKSKEKRGGHPG